jgi:hypothetical protein
MKNGEGTDLLYTCLFPLKPTRFPALLVPADQSLFSFGYGWDVWYVRCMRSEGDRITQEHQNETYLIEIIKAGTNQLSPR